MKSKFYLKQIIQTNLLSTKGVVLLLGVVTSANSQPDVPLMSLKSRLLEASVPAYFRKKMYVSRCLNWKTAIGASNKMDHIHSNKELSLHPAMETCAHLDIKNHATYQVELLQEPKHCFPLVLQLLD